MRCSVRHLKDFRRRDDGTNTSATTIFVQHIEYPRRGIAPDEVTQFKIRTRLRFHHEGPGCFRKIVRSSTLFDFSLFRFAGLIDTVLSPPGNAVRSFVGKLIAAPSHRSHTETRFIDRTEEAIDLDGANLRF